MARVAEFDRQNIFDELDVEREYQDKLWGGPKVDDLNNSLNDWVAYITRYSTKWAIGISNLPSDSDVVSERFRESMIKTAALAIAAIESTDRFMKGRN